jgi:hypothetical protein
VDDVVVLLQALEPHGRRIRDLAQDFFRDPVAVQLVEGSAVHKLHAYVHSAFLEEGAVKVDDVRRQAAMQNVELHDDGRKLGVVELQSYLLHGHDGAGCSIDLGGRRRR